MNNKERTELGQQMKGAALELYHDLRSQNGNQAPIGLVSEEAVEKPLSRDELEVIASSADITETDPTTHLRIQLGERKVGDRYEVRVAYAIDELLGEPFTALNGQAPSAYRAAAKRIFHRMKDHKAITYEINPLAQTTAKGETPFATPQAENLGVFRQSLDSYLKARLNVSKD